MNSISLLLLSFFSFPSSRTSFPDARRLYRFRARLSTHAAELARSHDDDDDDALHNPDR